MSFTIGAVLLVAAAVFFIVQPLLTGQSAPLDRAEDEMTDAEATRRVKLLALRDVEYDFVTGKMDESDYHELRRELSAEALEALDAVEKEAAAREGPSDDDVEDEIARVREGLQAGLTCGVCGSVNPEGSRFCSGCGGRLQAGSTAAPEG